MREEKLCDAEDDQLSAITQEDGIRQISIQTRDSLAGLAGASLGVEMKIKSIHGRPRWKRRVPGRPTPC